MLVGAPQVELPVVCAIRNPTPGAPALMSARGRVVLLAAVVLLCECWGGVSCGGVPVTAMEWSCPAAMRTTLALRRSPSTRRGVRLR